MTQRSGLLDTIGAEGRLVLAGIGGDPRAPVAALLTRDIDWQRVLHIARRHRVIPNVHRFVERLAVERVPAGVREELHQGFHRGARHNLLLSRAMLRLLERFHDQGIRALPYKGVVLAHALYGGVSLRQVHDIDLLLAEADFQRSRELLLASGHLPAESFDQEQSFRHDETGIEVDLHWGLTPRYFALRPDFDGLWERRASAQLHGASVPTLGPEDRLLVLCVQLAKDCWERFRRVEHVLKLLDIATLVRTHPDLDWEAIDARAQALGIRRVVRFALRLAADLFGTTLPPVMQVEKDPALAKLVRSVSIPLFQEDTRTRWRGVVVERAAQFLFYLRLRERPRERWTYCREILRTALR